MTHPGTPGRSGLLIESLRIYKFDIPLKEVFTIASMSLSKAENLLVEIRTSQGLTGWGEASPYRAIVGETQLINIAAARELAPLLRGRDPLEVHDLMAGIDAYLPHNSTLKSAVDMALHDLAAKACGLPLYAYLGGRRRTMETDLTIGIGDPEKAGEKALAYRAMGFRIIKVKLGLDFEDDLKRLGNIRRAVGPDVVLRIDANQGWDRNQARHHLGAFWDLGIEFCEQPCRAADLQGMAYLSRTSAIPVMADESLFSAADALEIIRQGAATCFNIKLSKSGGIHNAQKIAHVAEAGHLPCMIGCMSESRLGITAAAHFACANPVIQFYDLDSCLEHAENRIVGGVEYQGGMITMPEGPGIGAFPDPEFVRGLEEVS
jgi:L-alanine-DL-glutamate epimerase-like enolase superfamily enzyme